MLTEIRRLWEHVAWADGLLLAALAGASSPPAEAIREMAHVLGADETWLARIELRESTLAVWPALDVPDLRAVADRLHAGYARQLASLEAAGLSRIVAYTNSAGQSFETPLEDILLQVVLHAQYHRGKVNLLLRQAGIAPAPVDYIAFVRGAPAAVTPRRS